MPTSPSSSSSKPPAAGSARAPLAGKRQWDLRLRQALGAGPIPTELAYLLGQEAMAWGDVGSLGAAMRKPREPMSWEAEFARGGSNPLPGTGLEGFGLGLREPSHPIHQALRLAWNGDLAMLAAAIEFAGPQAKVKALEAAAGAAGASPFSCQAFDLLLDSIQVEPEPEGGWPLHREYDADGQLAMSCFGKDAAERFAIYPFGWALEKAMESGFAHAIRRMGQALGRQGTEAGAKPDRLLSYRCVSKCLEANADPIPAIVEALDWIEPAAARADMADLARAGAAALRSMRMGAERRAEILGAMGAKFEAMDLRAELGPGAPARGPGPRI